MISGSRPASTRRLRLLRLRTPRHELTLALLAGAAGAGLVFLATRQAWALVRTTPPRPLPVSLVTVTGAGMVPFADALVLACLASLAAVLATRRLLRRLVGVLLAVLGAVLATAVWTVSAAGAIAAASSSTSPAQTGAGSVTRGSVPASSAIPNVAGAAPHVTFAAVGWQALAAAGAIVIVLAGLLVVARADRMAVMSSRYDAPAGAGRTGATRRPGRGASQAGQSSVHGADGARAGQAADGRPAGKVAGPQGTDSASIWEALSRGDDPTAAAMPGDGKLTG